MRFPGPKLLPTLIVSAIALAVSGCPRQQPNSVTPMIALNNALSVVDLSQPTESLSTSGQASVSVARNGCCSFVVRLDSALAPAQPMLRLNPWVSLGVSPGLSPGLSSGSNTANSKSDRSPVISAYQVLPAPVNLDDAGFVRQTGQSGSTKMIPRVLLPLPIRANTTGIIVDLSAAHDPAQPASVGIHPQSGPVLIWIDLRTPIDAVAGEYSSTCDLIDASTKQTLGALPLKLTIENVTLPVERHLHFAAPLDWETLAKFYPDHFAVVQPRLMNRKDEPRLAVLRKIERYLQLAHENKADFYVPRLQPVVKWPLGQPPDADWRDFDSVVEPWLNGTAFTDRMPIAFWPLPAPDSLSLFDLPTQAQYWHVAARHFDHSRWLERSPVVLSQEVPGEINQAESLLLCAQARQVLSAYPHLTAMLPLHDDQLQFASYANPNAIDPQTTGRLVTASPGLIFPSPIRDWPTGAAPARHWVDAGAKDSSCHVTGIASEQGVRSLAAVAFARDASLILCGNPLPIPGAAPAQAAPQAAASSDQLIWCYPGDAYGVSEPLATVQLKWIRQAEQDYEYLFLASQAKDRASVLKMCRLIAKPVELQPGQRDLAIFNLLAGNTDPSASSQVRQLLIRTLASGRQLDSKPQATDAAQLDALRWFAARQRPTLLASGVHWMWDLDSRADDNSNGNWIDATIDLDLYNPAEETPGKDSLQWTALPPGWDNHPDPVDVPALAQYQVRRVSTQARFDLNKITADARLPLQLNLVDPFNEQTVPCNFSLPIAVSQRRVHSLNMDGQLNDWFPADAIQLEQPLIKMLNRPGLTAGEIQLADAPASLYTGWSDDHFYLAFRLGGISPVDLRSTRNFVKYDHGRAWGEDLCEVLLQPIYADNTTGPTMHVVCKPAGNWVERQSGNTPSGLAASAASTPPSNTWQDFEASGLRFASGVDPASHIWRGEIAIPWKAIAPAGHGRPTLLRFNFIQHQQSTAQSSSWAGPIDDSRNGGLSGLLVLRE